MEKDISFLNADSTPGPFDDVLKASLTLADEKHPSGSSDEDDDSNKERGGISSATIDELKTPDVDDDLADLEGEEPLPVEIPTGYVLVSSAPAGLTAALVKRPIELRLGVRGLTGTITWQSQAHTCHLYDYRVRFDRDGSTHSVNCRWPSTQWTARRRGVLAAAGGPCSRRWVCKESQQAAGWGT